MKPYLFFLYLVFVLLSVPYGQACAAELTGKAIIDEVSKRQDQPYEFEVQDITLIDKSGAMETRELQRYKREIDKQETRHLLVFTQPAGVKGVSLLTWQHQNAQDDQWLYLPANVKYLKRIAKNGRKNYFMGTDYTFEDLASEDKDKYAYERLPDETLNGAKCFVITSVAADAELQKETGYKFHKMWIAQDHYVIVQIDFFDGHEQLIKRQRNMDWVNVAGNTYRAGKIEMEHFLNPHKTQTTIRERSFEQSAVPENYFKERSITDGSLLQ